MKAYKRIKKGEKPYEIYLFRLLCRLWCANGTWKLDVICHSTTRSKIDVLDSVFDGEADGIKVRYQVESAYSSNRNTYIYNTEEETDIAVIITDSPNNKQYNKYLLPETV